jgi:hypothetical protein
MGDQIVAERPHFWVLSDRGGIVHHGIDIGDGTAIHYAKCTSINDHMVVRTNLRAFSKDAKCAVVDYKKLLDPQELQYYSKGYAETLIRFCEAPIYSPTEMVERAISSLGSGLGQYSPGKFNCEHFATGVRTDLWYSEQAAFALDRIDRERGRRKFAALFYGAIAEGTQYLTSKSKNTNNYLGNLYTYDDMFFCEKYNSPYNLPPQWLQANSLSGPWVEIEQKSIPYPLQEVQILMEQN